jgi:signal transduction histidine kinase
MQSPNSNWYLIVVIIFLTTAIIVFYGYIIFKTIKNYNKKSLELQRNIEELKHREEKLILQTEIEIREQTFQFISMEIHDNITQVLSLAKLHLNCMELIKDEENYERLMKSRELLSKVLTDLSNLSRSLDSDLIESHGLLPAIEYEVERWRRFTNDPIELKVVGTIQHMDPRKELLVFRIVQESLNNIMKYAKATQVDIVVENTDNEMKISIQDNGVGFELDKVYENKKVGQMAGLKNMRQRADTINAKLNILSTPGKGSTIEVIIPVFSKSLIDDTSRISRRSQTIA